MAARFETKLLGAAIVLSLSLQQACTDNEPARVLPSQGTAGDETGSGARPAGKGGTGGSSGGSAARGGSAGSASAGMPGTGGSEAGGAGQAGSDAGSTSAGGEGGSPAADPCLPPCDDPAGCELSPVEQLEVDFCRFYTPRCPDQPADVMMDPGPGDPVAAGPAVPSTPTRPQLSEAEAETYTVERALRAGGVYTVSYSGAGAAEGGAGGEAGAGAATPLGTRTVSYASEDGWDPRGPIEDVNKIVPGLLVDPEGDTTLPGVHKTIQSAISEAVLVAGCPRVFIKVAPGTYREKVTVPAKTSTPPITLYGVDRDPSKVVIVAGHSAAGAEGNGTPLSIHQSATFTNSLPQPFQARNLTFANDYVLDTYPGAPEQQTAVALLTQSDRALFDNVRILGHRNALYVKSTGANEVARAYFRNSYLEGDEDIILGRGAAVFDQCRIHSLGDQTSGGAISAASTRADNPHGILIINSELTADARVSNVYLGRQWYEGNDELAVGKTIVRNSILGAHIRATDVWAETLRATPKTPTPAEMVLYDSDDYYPPMTGLIPPEIYLAEFGNSGPGAPQELQ